MAGGPSHALADPNARINKRKVRKGTQSCWECKRRKVRCVFATPTDNVCRDCRRRGSLCIGQEFPEDVGRTASGLGERLGRLEALVGQLLREVGQRQNSPQEPSDRALAQLAGQPPPLDAGGKLIDLRLQPSLSFLGSLFQGPGGAETHDGLSRTLLTAWPSKRDLDSIVDTGAGSLGLFHGLICTPYSEFMGQELPAPRELLQDPPVDSHPVLVARKLLMLGLYLQGLSVLEVSKLGHLGTSPRDMMHRAVETAVRLVTSHDGFSGTVEGIECIMMESMYHNNAGSLRLAYLAMRRALVAAQMIALGQSNASPPSHAQVLDPSTRRRINPELMWFRIVQSDRYLSLMLGLPHGTSDGDFARPERLESCGAMERLERMDCLAGGRILERNCADIQDLQTTQEIDRLLQNAAASMPPQWWLAPDLDSGHGSALHARDLVRLMNQFAHYHLLQRLHLPYLLHSPANDKYQSSKITAIMASRELLSRFVSYRSSPGASSFCRGVDFLAFIANTALCLAHIKAQRHNHVAAAADNNDSFGFLAHQRLSDRGLMELALERLESAADVGADAIAAKIALVNRHLLLVESDAALGGNYLTNSPPGANGGELECSGRISKDGDVLQIYIPYLGNVRVERSGPNKARDQWGSSRLQRRTRKTIGKKKKEQAKGPKEAPKDADPTQLQGMLDYLQSLGGKFEDLGYQKTEEVDMNVGYGEEEEQDEDFDSPYLEKEEETDLIKAAQKRAREHLIPIQRQRPDQVHPDPNLRVYQSGSLLDHPLSAILRALHIPDDIFSSNPPRFTGVSLGRSAQELSLEARISPSQKHLVVRYSEDVWRIEGQGESSSLTLPPLLYLCWRTVALGNMRGRTYPANQTPRSPNVPLEYITFWDIRNGKTLVVLNRVSELPGYGLKHYQDPDGRKNRFAYFFNVALLERYHEGSAEAEALASLLGTTEILSVIKILQDFPNGLYQAKIQSIFFVLEYPKTAVMFVQLVLQAPGNSVLSSSTLGVSTELDFLVDEQPASNRNLIITSQGLKLEHHPLGVQEAHPGPSYFAGSAEYVLASGMQPKVNFQYSRLEKHLVLDRLQHFSYGDESSSIRTLANILNSIWIRQTGAVQLNHITLLGLTGFTGGYIKKKTQSPNGYRALKFDNPEEIYPILRDLVQIKSRDILVLQALLEEGAAVFGEYQVTVLMIGVHDKHGACLVMSIAHDPGRPINTDGESLFGAAEDPPMLALRRGTYSKAQTEFMTLTYLEDQPIYANELRSMSIDRRQQLLKDDASLVKNVELISSPADISECHSMGTDELPSFLSDIIAWSFERQDGTKFDDGQLRWRAKMASELPQDDFKLTSAASPFCRFSLSVPDSSIPNEKLNPQDLALPGLETIEIKDFWLAVNREFGNILLSTKFPESEGETGASSVVMRFGDAIWALWIRHQEATFKSDMRSWTRFKRGLFGLRHITIPQPSAQTTKVLQGLYKRYDLNKEETQLFVNTEYGVEIPTEHQTPKESLKRRVLLTLNGLAEVYAIDDLCRRIFLRPYPVLNPKRRVGALWIKWDRDLPQLIISLDDFVFENKDADGKNFKTAIAIRGRPDLKEVTEVGCGVTWSSRSSYAFEISDFINVHGQGVPEYDVQENPKLSGCPKEIQDFVGSLPWQAENLTPGKINDLRRLAVETSANAQVVSLKGGPITSLSKLRKTGRLAYHNKL
ncbi:hypothetical protein Dda_0005 [Drechslerella dactyloides]|uniref:Zn(2)-C6 fungal-type domain-containing protein n=1 Tax=Drechslerella dactyloides TaxID=74499 RepID=A0AAD6J3Q7_DREDA|nr:hypothetical protein Dda_0005 [Drechslerella dactyloides]